MSSVKKVFLEISQNSQENICARVSFLMKSQEICKSTFSYRTPSLTASALNKDSLQNQKQAEEKQNLQKDIVEPLSEKWK